MMDFSSVIDAGLAVTGGLAVLMMGLWTLSSESSTVSTSRRAANDWTEEQDYSWPKAA